MSTNHKVPSFSDKYNNYLEGVRKPKNNLFDPLNLFDDHNETDRAWQRIAQDHLSRK